MDESQWIFNVFYALFCMLIIYPTEEFQRLGLTIEQLFSSWLGEEHLNFILYQQRRTSLYLFVHSCLPAVYFLVCRVKFNGNVEYELDGELMLVQSLLWRIAEKFSVMTVLTVSVVIYNWHQNNWKRHPITRTLMNLTNEPHTLINVISEINTEFRRPTRFEKKLNSVSRLITTDNWIMKTSLYNTYFAFQQDSTLRVIKTNTYNVSQDTTDRLQLVTVLVEPNRSHVSTFDIHINALEFVDLEDKIGRPIIIPTNIQFYRNVIDRFIDVFKQQVALNGIYRVDRTIEKCFACMINEPNIKIHKQCLENGNNNVTNNTRCSNCNCVPMWCVDCLGRWFAIRQKDYNHEVWLEQKCSCPMCRATFCLLDVSYIERSNNTTTTENTDNLLS